MMTKLKIYSTGCPKCRVLESKLKSKNLDFEICNSIEEMQTKGIQSVPWLEVDGSLMEFGEAVRWVNQQ